MILALLPMALAAELALQIDTRHLVVGQSVPVKLQVINGRSDGTPILPVSEGLLAQYQGSSQQHVIVNFESTRITEFTYQLAATKEGSWTVGPVNLVVDGKPLTAGPIEIAVGKPPVQQGGDPVMASVTTETPFVGQVVVYRFQFKYDRPLVNARWGRPEFPGFVEEVNTEAVQREFQMTDGGKPYTVQTIEVPLVASGTGPQLITPAALTAQFRAERKQRNRRNNRRSIDDLFNDSPFGLRGSTETLTLATKAVEVDILPLPLANQPADFSGLVGQFTLRMRAGERTVKMGESVTVEVVLEGDGTLAGYSPPSASDDAGFRVYDDEPTVVTKLADGRFRSRLTLRRAVVPEREGRLDVPPIQIRTFNPVTSEYETVSTAPLRLQVLAGEEGGGVVESFVSQDADSRRSVESTGEDILPVVRTGRVYNRTVADRLPQLAGFAAVPGGFWVLLSLVGWFRGRGVDPRSALRSQLKALPAEPAARLAALEHSFREAAALKLGIPAPAVNVDALKALGDEWTTLYQDLDQARYGGGDSGSIEARVKRIVGAL